ncbi:hypothetical protein [Streptomyces sp. CBMA123]|uniref:hypothetical protein n=1 Tax=Streptomyces sp. CBMA123 TaxID=1896313 RepID=UPI001661DD4A|nr:hypothetical protein [Streptomyces sp. CBMA123]
MPELSPAEEGGKEERKRIDLSVAQVVASALAAVVGALLASELGVYGTIMGAAVVSIGATTGGAVFQHVFRRTGEQLRDAVDRGPNQAVNTLRQAPVGPERPERPAELPAGPPPVITSEWNEPQVVRARRRLGWKGYAAASGLVFVLAMTPIVAFELATGQPVSATVKGESGNGTSFGGTVAPGGQAPKDAPADRPSTGGGRGPESTPSGGASAPATTRPTREPSPTPSAGTGGHGGDASPLAGPSASPSAGASPSASGGKPTGGAVTPQPPVPTDAPANATVAPPAGTSAP